MATPNIDDFLPLPSGPNIDDFLPLSLDPSSPAGIVEAEREVPSISKLGLRAALGTGEEGKGQLRVGLGNVIDFLGKAVKSHPLVATAEKAIGRPDPVSSYVRNIGQATEELGRENIAEARELGAGVGGGKAGDIAQALGSTFTVSAPAIPAAVLGGLPAAAAVAGATQFGISRGDYKDYFRKKGFDEETAERKAEIPAVIGGAITATLTRAIPGGTEMLLQRLSTGELTRGGLTQIVKRGVGEVLKEMPEEGLDQIGQGFTERLLVNPSKTIEEIANETGFAMAAAGLMAGTTAGSLVAIGKTAEGISRPIEERIESRDFERRSRRIADVQARLGFTPTGRTTTTERTYDTQAQGQVPPGQSQGQVAGGIPIQESRTETGAPGQVLETPQAIAAQTGWTLSPVVQQGALTPEQVATLTPEQQAELPPPSWEFTDPKSGVTTYVPVGSTLEQGLAAIKAKQQEILQGGRRSPQQDQVGKPGPIPVTPPATTSTTPGFWNQIDTSTELQAISRPEIDALVKEFQAAYPNAPRIIVADNKRDLEVLTGQRFPQNDPAGAIVRSPVTGNTVFVVADRMTSGDRLKAILAHEAIGHHGVEAVMRDDFRALALAVEQKLRNTDQWRDIVNRYGGRGRTFGTEDNVIFGSELMARMSEGNIEDLSLWEQIVAFIRKWWRDHVSRTNPISDAEIRKALVDARKFLQGTGQKPRPAGVIVASNATLVPPGTRTDFAITAYHGTPHEVDKFTTAKIGTGEGAQVYGWGLYFAQNPEVAKRYAESLTANRSRAAWTDTRQVAADTLRDYNGDIKSARGAFEQDAKEGSTFAGDVLAALADPSNLPPPTTGQEYTVSLDVTDDQLLDWDKPLSQQPIATRLIQAAIKSLNIDLSAVRGEEAYDFIRIRLGQERTFGSGATQWSGQAPDSKAASDFLNSLGIKGIRYLDQGSRAQSDAHILEMQRRADNAVKTIARLQADRAALDRDSKIADAHAELAYFTDAIERSRERTYNYVIFDENVIKITGKNGQPVSIQEAQDNVSFALDEPTQPEENPFDKMRRESGAEPPPELTPEQQAARDRNEKQRGMRPNPLTSFALEPADEAAFANGDDMWANPVRTIIGGEEDFIINRLRVTPESTVESQQHAKKIFDEAGVKVEWLEALAANPERGQPSKGIWKYVKESNEEGGRKLVQLLERELRRPVNDETVLLLGSLVNSIRYNDRLGNAEGVFDLPTRLDLYSKSQAKASRAGAELQQYNQHPAWIDNVARNVEAELNNIYADAFGGEVIDGVMADIRRGTQSFITRPLIQHVLAQNPTLQGALDLVTTLNEDLKGLPDAVALLEEVFATPFYNLNDFGKALEKRLVEQYKVDPKEAAKIAKEFQAAFNPSLKQGANEALKIAVSNLPYEKKARVKGKKSIETLVTEAINKGALESGEVLRKIAKEQGWTPPSDQQIDQMKRLNDRLNDLKNLRPAALAELKKTGATPEQIENARKEKVAALGSEIARVRKEMEIAWSRMTKPIKFTSLIPFTGSAEVKANTARAINEFIAANLLAKLGFGTRQWVAIFSQFLSFVPTRSIANALVNNAHAKDWKEKQPFIKEVATQLRDGYKQQFGAIRPALAAAQAAFLGRAESRSVLDLMRGINALDRLTKQAEERWAAGDYARASLLYFVSSVKLGYRIAQGLDRIQGVPAHYQNMRAQVVRALMDAGKTRLEADNSADLVIGDMNAQWMLATARARDLLVEAGVEPTAQKIRQNAWNVVKRWQYQRIQELGLKADEFEAESDYMENTIGWNQREVKGLGGALARGLRQVERVAESKGLPLVMTRFSNAIGITINRMLAYTPFWEQANKGGPGESAWFKSEVDRAQRRVEGYVGTAMGAIALMLAYSGMLVVRTKWPKDKEERDLFERQGHRPNTVEIPTGDNEFIPISLNNSPFMLVAPYLAAGAALREKVTEIAKKQAALDAHAAELGVTAERLPGPSIGDYGLMAMAAAQQAVLGGRTVSGLIGSVSTYGTPNAKKTASSYISALTPWLPGAQEVTRMGGVTLDERMATVGDFLLPLPTSQARKVNLLGDPVKTPGDIQRITQILTGGSYPGIVEGNRAKEEAAYRALFESGYRPPSINPLQGYLINGTIRPMKGLELQRYTEARGRNLKEALAGFVATGNPDEDKKTARDLYKQANDAALAEVGAENVPRRTTGTTAIKAPSAPRAARPRSGVRSARRLRSPRLRGGRIRRLRPVRSGRRVRRIRSVRLAA